MSGGLTGEGSSCTGTSAKRMGISTGARLNLQANLPSRSELEIRAQLDVAISIIATSRPSHWSKMCRFRAIAAIAISWAVKALTSASRPTPRRWPPSSRQLHRHAAPPWRDRGRASERALQTERTPPLRAALAAEPRYRRHDVCKHDMHDRLSGVTAT